jgi:hypothetical protein
VARVEREAEEFVRKHWRDIERLADELFEHGSLNHEEIARVLEPSRRPEGESLLDGVPFRHRRDGYIAPAPDARTIGAYHESGHALVAVALGQKVQRLSVNSDGTGLCRVSQPSTAGNRKALLNYCAVACAGSIAASKLTGENRWSMGDHKNIERKLGEVDVREAVSIMHEARKLATRIIDENWGSVRDVARQLHRRGELSRVDVANLLPELCVAA